jgi:prevent-host-death family protein
MDTWTLDDATHELPEVVRRALDGEPQVVVPAGNADDAVVVLARSEYQRLTAPPTNLYDFLRNSPLAQAVRDGMLDPDVFEGTRDRSPPRDVDLS